jgi:subtilisin family serine protease
MYEYRYGGRDGAVQQLVPANEFVAVRAPQGQLESLEALESLPEVEHVVVFESAGLVVLEPSAAVTDQGLRASVLESIDDAAEVLPEGRVLKDGTGAPVVYTSKVFVQFSIATTADEASAALDAYPTAKRESLKIAPNSFILTFDPAIGADVFRIANELLDDPRVLSAHPELLREGRARDATKKQWHLRSVSVGGVTVDQHCNAVEAWAISRGKGAVIAIIDDGVDTSHPELSGPGKVVHPFDATRNTEDGSPKRKAEKHGTACAGVACATGKHRASGVAPEAALMPIRLASNIGSFEEQRAFEWAADKGADVISCSWGPPDGVWWQPADPLHTEVVPLSDLSRAAIKYALEHGRGGKGCVITWAAGNGNESADNDGYASHPGVIAVAACNDRGVRSVYSDFGKAVWCAFPSNDFEHAPLSHPGPYTAGIWTTDRRGAQGYNPGHFTPGDNEDGDPDGDYTATFGGTSSACPGVAGIAALMLAANPALRGEAIKALLKKACVRLDEAHGDYDAQGHSPLYGYGRVNAAIAVQLAKDATP